MTERFFREAGTVAGASGDDESVRCGLGLGTQVPEESDHSGDPIFFRIFLNLLD